MPIATFYPDWSRDALLILAHAFNVHSPDSVGLTTSTLLRLMAAYFDLLLELAFGRHMARCCAWSVDQETMAVTQGV